MPIREAETPEASTARAMPIPGTSMVREADIPEGIQALEAMVEIREMRETPDTAPVRAMALETPIRDRITRTAVMLQTGRKTMFFPSCPWFAALWVL